MKEFNKINWITIFVYPLYNMTAFMPASLEILIHGMLVDWSRH